MAATHGNVLFISHHAADRPYAVALEKAIHAFVQSTTLIDIRYSTSRQAGPQGGEQWRKWIDQQVIDARSALIVVTPHALAKPWLLWEAGACRGAALAQAAAAGDAGSNDAGGRRFIVSIAYGLAESECPDPLRGDQVILGAQREGAEALLYQIVDRHEVPRSVERTGRTLIDGILDDYLAAVRTAMLQSPSQVTEANVQDWLARLEALVSANRHAELPDFERWMMLAFGRDAEGESVPIDVRLHRRLGMLYLGERDFARACAQLALARRAAPRDIFVLRPLGESRMKQLLAQETADAAARDDVASVLAAIEDLDARAFVSSPDAAALFGKYVRRVLREPERAASVYARALAANPESYYLADLLAQTQLESGRLEEARATYAGLLAIVERLAAQSTWSHASAATAHLVLGDIDKAGACIEAATAAGDLSQSQIDAIAQGLREVAQRAGVEAQARDDLLARLARAAGKPRRRSGFNL